MGMSDSSMTDRIMTGNDRGVGITLMKDQQQKFRVGSPSWQSGLARGMSMCGEQAGMIWLPVYGGHTAQLV